MIVYELKPDEKIEIGKDIFVRFERFKGERKARVWVEAPGDIPIKKVKFDSTAESKDEI